jgi:tetratricopeptide (TPR) repeat protein
MSGTHLRANAYMRLMAHFPMLLHANPEKALLLCLGVGNTGSAIAAHNSIQRIDVVDLNKKIFETLPEFSATTYGLHNDNRLRLINDDGRNFLNITDQRYDLITSEPPPPLAAGVYRLYSREYYQAALDRLTPEGLMTQWLPVFLMSPESVAMAISTFIDVFPNSFLFTGFGTDFILVGGRSPFNFQRIEERFFDSPTVVSDLAKFRIKNPADLLARIVQGDEQLRKIYGAERLISDKRNNLDTMLLNPLNRPVVAYDPAEVMDYISAHSTGNHEEVRQVLAHLGRLRYHVQGFPFESLASVSQQSEAALAGIDWLELARLHRAHDDALAAGRPDIAMRTLQEILTTSIELPDVLLLLAQIYLQQQYFAEALNLIDRFQTLEPDVPVGYQLKGQIYRITGQPEKALSAYREAYRLDPEAYGPINGMAWIMATHPDTLREPPEALRLAKRADALANGANVEVLETLAAAYAANGEFQLAVEVVRKILEDTQGDRYINREKFNNYLNAYSQGKPVVVQAGN